MNGAYGAPLVPRRLASATFVVLCLLVLAGATWLASLTAMVPGIAVVVVLRDGPRGW